LRQFISNHLIFKLLTEQTLNDKLVNSIENSLILKLTNLPDKVASFFDSKKTNHILTANIYFKHLLVDIWLTLKHLMINHRNDYKNITFISTLMGKISFLGYSQLFSKYILKNLIINCYNCTEWTEMSKQLFNSLPYNYLESCLINVLTISTCSKDVSMVLNNLVITNKDIKYILVDKFLFLRTLSNVKIIQNLIGYFYDCQQRRDEIYYKVFSKLLNTWSNQTSIQNTPYEQHLYLTRSIIICISFMNDKDKEMLSNDLMRPLLNGVEQHLHSSIQTMRILGMIVGENLLNNLNDNLQLKALKFEVIFIFVEKLD
jgi:hypothetical protein